MMLSPTTSSEIGMCIQSGTNDMMLQESMLDSVAIAIKNGPPEHNPLSIGLHACCMHLTAYRRLPLISRLPQ